MTQAAAASEREKGTYFEELMLAYLRNEASYRDLYAKVWTYADWAGEQGLDKRDAGIDLVAQTQTGEVHAIQCKLYASDYRLQKSDIDSFFTASGKKPFAHRIIVSTCLHWSEHAEDALRDQQPPVSKIDLTDLEASQIDWAQYQPQQAPTLKPKKALRPHQQSALNATLAGFARESRGKLIMASGIVNDANDWAIETMGNPRYPLELFQRVVTVSLETQKIVAALPSLDI